jgi:hypothetical protein
MNDTKSIKASITTSNEVKSESKKISGLTAIGGIKIGDPINRLDIVFGIDTGDRWREFTQGIYQLTDFGWTDNHLSRHSADVQIFKGKNNTIKAIVCSLRYDRDSSMLFSSGGAVGEGVFYTNPSKCDGDIVKLFSPIYTSPSLPGYETVSKILGNPLSVNKMGENRPFEISFRAPEIRRLEYKNTYLYTQFDRVIGMAIFDDEVKELHEKIEAGLIKIREPNPMPSNVEIEIPARTRLKN